MSDDIPYELAQLVAVFVQAALYGVYLVTFGYCAIRYLHRPAGWIPFRKIEWRIFAVASILWVTSTVNLALGMLRAAEVLILSPGRPSVWIGLAKTVSTSLLILVADSMMVWRFWVVYQRSLVATLVPIILWLSCLGMAVWTFYLQIVLNTEGLSALDDLLATDLKPVCEAFWALTLTLNLYATCAIVLCIWRVERETNKALQDCQYNRGIEYPRDTSLRKTMKMVIDSGAIYSLVSTSVFVSQLFMSNAIFITSAIDIIVIGITFNLIALRIASRHRHDESRKDRQDTIARATLQFSGMSSICTDCTNQHSECSSAVESDGFRLGHAESAPSGSENGSSLPVQKHALTCLSN